MNDDVVSEQEEQTTSEEAPATSGEGAASGGGTARLITFAMPPIDRLLVWLGGVAMVLAALLSWIEVAPDAFPNFAGVGAGGGGTGLIVLLVGLALLLRRLATRTVIGLTLGAFLASLIAVLNLVGEDDGTGMGAGAWVAMIGAAIALAGSCISMTDSEKRSKLQIIQLSIPALGAVLAGVGSFALDWGIGLSDSGVSGGFDGATTGGGAFIVGRMGIPILVLAVIGLVCLLGTANPTGSAGTRGVFARVLWIAAVGISVMAAASVAGSLLTPFVAVGSGPIVALVGGILMARSVQPA